MAILGDEETLDAVLDALANRHRREIVRTLGLYPCSLSHLADLRELSLPALHKHVKVLERAELVVRRKQGRTNFLTLNPRPLGSLQEWLGGFHPYWSGPQATLENYAGFLDRSSGTHTDGPGNSPSSNPTN